MMSLDTRVVCLDRLLVLRPAAFGPGGAVRTDAGPGVLVGQRTEHQQPVVLRHAPGASRFA